MTVFLPIKSCDRCPFNTIERHYTADPFEMVFDWRCKKRRRRIAFVDTSDPTPAIPEWCPLRAFTPTTQPT